LFTYASVNSSCGHPPRDSGGHLYAYLSPRPGICNCVLTWGPGICQYRVITSGICRSQRKDHGKEFPLSYAKTDNFIGKDESFVTSWLTKEGLDRLVDIFKGRLSCFSSNIINIFVFNNIKTLLVFNCFEFELVCVYVNLYFISVRFTMS
jgi:hypothetical protein